MQCTATIIGIQLVFIVLHNLFVCVCCLFVSKFLRGVVPHACYFPEDFSSDMKYPRFGIVENGQA